MAFRRQTLHRRRRLYRHLPKHLALLWTCVFLQQLLAAAAQSFSYGFGGPDGFPFGPRGKTPAIDNTGYYGLLGVPKTADDRAITKAFRKLAIKLHPDKKGGDPEKFKLIGEAYEVLSDPKKRALYDRGGKAAVEGGGVPDTGMGMEELFAALFGGGRRAHQDGPKRMRDESYEVKFSLDDLYEGRALKARLPKVSQTARSASRQPPELKDIEIVPKKGMRTGSRIVFEDWVESDTPGVEPGNLVFVVDEAPHPVFTRVGDHLVADLTLTLNEALTGFSKPFRGLGGRTWLVKSRPGKVLRPDTYIRIPEAGMPVLEGQEGDFGDLYLKIKVLFPSDAEANAWDKETLTKLRKLLPKPPKQPKTQDAVEANAEEPDPETLREISRNARSRDGPQQYFSFGNMFEGGARPF